jgi:hypothetical protein
MIEKEKEKETQTVSVKNALLLVIPSLYVLHFSLWFYIGLELWVPDILYSQPVQITESGFRQILNYLPFTGLHLKGSASFLSHYITAPKMSHKKIICWWCYQHQNRKLGKKHTFMTWLGVIISKNENSTKICLLKRAYDNFSLLVI